MNKWEISNHKSTPNNVFDILYTGERDNVTGTIGFIFKINKPLIVYALGRAVNQSISKGKLKNDHEITLLELKTNITIAKINVGPNSPIDSIGYAYEMLKTPIILQNDKEYILCSSETANSGDPWYSRELCGKEEYKYQYISLVKDYMKSGGVVSAHNIKKTGYGMTTLFVNEMYENITNLLPHIQFEEEIENNNSTLINSVVLESGDNKKTVFNSKSYSNCVVEFTLKINSIREDSTLLIGYLVDGLSEDKNGYYYSISNRLSYKINNHLEFKSQITYKAGDVITILLNTKDGSFSMKVNDNSIGVLYGPKKIFPFVSVDTEELPIRLHLELKKVNIEISITNMYKLYEIPLLLDIYKTLLILCGKMTSIMIKSVKITELENKVEPYLKWNLMKGGLESDYNVYYNYIIA